MKIPKIELPQKPTYLKVSDGVDFFGLFAAIERQYETCFLLESLGEQGSFSRYSIIGFGPSHIISAREHTLKFDSFQFEVENPYLSLRDIVSQHAIAKNYAGGLVGYLSYEAVNYFEPGVAVKVHPLFDQFKFGVYEDGLILDKITGEMFYFYYSKNRISEVERLMKQKVATGKFSAKFLGDTLSQEDHQRAVESVKEMIRAGNTFQCEVGFKSEFEITGDTLSIYEKLRRVNPSPFMYYLKFPSTSFGDAQDKSSGQVQKIIGASPELMLSLRDGDLETVPLAGTIRRGKTEKEDQELARKLLNDEKEVAEHNMLVDLHRNDLGRVSQFGTVKVKSLMDIRRFSHVQHIASEITGVLKDDEDMFSAVSANFPMGTVTGTPKVETMKIIDRNESEARGPYAGGVGHFGFKGDCTFAATLRSLFISGTYAYAQTSSGIVYDSDPAREYDEVERKLAAIKEVLDTNVSE